VKPRSQSNRTHTANLGLAAAFVLSMTTAACTSRASSPTEAEHTVACAGCNVVLISLDTVRADHLGIYGYGRATSPNLDRFASTALVFENALSQSAWTLPAHASMFTGLYPRELGLEAYPADRRIPASAKTLAETFHQNGYLTAGFTGGGFVAGAWGFARGFDIYTTGGRRFEHNLRQAIDWLTSNEKRRFFLFLHGYDAHRPYYSEVTDKKAVGGVAGHADQLDGYCSNSEAELPEGVSANRRPGSERLHQIVGYYDAAIHHADRSLAALFSALDDAEIAQRTIVLVTADHGEEFFEHGHCDHVRFLYNETIHVPFLLRVPGMTGRRIKGPVPASVSIANTLIELTGLGPVMPGPSLLPRIRGQSPPAAAVYSQTGSKLGYKGSLGRSAALSTLRFKLISYPEVAAVQAFDLWGDPGEQHALPSTHPFYARKAQLEAWQRSLTPLPAEPIHAAERSNGGTPVPEPAIREHLRALGYLQ